MSYINKTDAINELLIKGHSDAAKTLWDFPTADVVERKKGKWIDSYDLSGNKYKRCSECGTRIEITFFANDYSVIFCPHCGADMWEE